MSKGERWTVAIGIIGLVLMGVNDWISLVHEEEHRAGIMNHLALFLLTAIVVLVNGYAIYKNLKDAHRAKKLEAQIAILNEEREPLDQLVATLKDEIGVKDRDYSRQLSEKDTEIERLKQHKEEAAKAQRQHDTDMLRMAELKEQHRREARQATEQVELLREELAAKDKELESLKTDVNESPWKGVLGDPTTADKPPRHLLSYKTRGEQGGEQGYFALSSVWFKAYTLVIENVSWRDNPVPVYNVRASIEYQHRNGYARIVLSPATWVTRDVTHSFRASVSIPPTPEEAQMGALVVLWEDKSEAKKKWALATPGAEDPKELTPGRWDVKIVLTADNCDTYSGTGGFTVMPDNQIVWGEPPVFTFGYEATASA